MDFAADALRAAGGERTMHVREVVLSWGVEGSFCLISIAPRVGTGVTGADRASASKMSKKL